MIYYHVQILKFGGGVKCNLLPAEFVAVDYNNMTGVWFKLYPITNLQIAISKNFTKVDEQIWTLQIELELHGV